MIDFDHVYVESALEEDAEVQLLLRTIAPNHVTTIENAASYFNRPGQEFSVQKRRPKLVLARKTGTLLYAGDERIQSFGTEQQLFYTDPVRNCLYDCDYCFLQGMHRSANILYHVNFRDYLAAVDRHLQEHKSLYLSISYLSDLLGFERLFGLVRRWISARRDRPGLEIEVRTKSDGYAAIADLKPDPGTILTWSLSPSAIASRHEYGTAAFRQRVLDAARAIQRGWRVRLCFDPVIVHPEWQTAYRESIAELFRRVSADGIEAVTFGVFRMQQDFFERLPGARDDDAPLWGAAIVGSGDAPASYSEYLRGEVFAFLETELSRYLAPEKVFSVHG